MKAKTYQERKQHGSNSVTSGLKACIVLLPWKEGEAAASTLLK
jgi:hypothetical protein